MNWIDRPIEPTKLSRRGGPRRRYHTAEERQAGRERSRVKAYEKFKATMADAARTRHAAGLNEPPRPRPPAHVLADAERIKYL